MWDIYTVETSPFRDLNTMQENMQMLVWDMLPDRQPMYSFYRTGVLWPSQEQPGTKWAVDFCTLCNLSTTFTTVVYYLGLICQIWLEPCKAGPVIPKLPFIQSRSSRWSTVSKVANKKSFSTSKTPQPMSNSARISSCTLSKLLQCYEDAYTQIHTDPTTC